MIFISLWINWGFDSIISWLEYPVVAKDWFYNVRMFIHGELYVMYLLNVQLPNRIISKRYCKNFLRLRLPRQRQLNLVRMRHCQLGSCWSQVFWWGSDPRKQYPAGLQYSTLLSIRMEVNAHSSIVLKSLSDLFRTLAQLLVEILF